MIKRNENKKNGGQVMVMVIVIIGGLLLSATAIAGLLTVYQIRQSSDIINSAQAFFAADAAIEWQLANYNKNYEEPLVFENGATANSNLTILQDSSLDFTSRGFAGNAVRTLETIFANPQ